jgi:conjugal transfer pilus assembly protein TraD
VQNYVEREAPDFHQDLQAALSKVENASMLKRAAAAVRFYREFVQETKGNSDLEGLLTMFQHDKAHFSKMIASLLPIMNMLTSGDLGPMLSPERMDQDDTRPIYDTRKITEQNKVAYIGLDSLTDAMVGSAIGSMILSDLAAVAGDRYNYGTDLRPVNIFVDECAEVINDPLIQILNKGRGAKLRLFVATQTIADFEARLGDAAKATQVLGNINNNISLRVIDPDTQKYITDNLPLTRVKYVMRTQGMSSDSNDPAVFGGNHGERLMEEEAPLLQPQLLGYLPNLEYIAKISGGRIVKGRLPILVEKKESKAA